MVECQPAQEAVFQTECRVIKSIKKFTNEANVKCLVASGSKYSHNQMDGKVSFLTADQLVDASSGGSPGKTKDLPTQ